MNRVTMTEKLRWNVGSHYYSPQLRRNGWGKFFDLRFRRQDNSWELSWALFGRTLWVGRTY